jgi:hypothetical protein
MPAFHCITPPPPVETLRLPHRLESLCYNPPRSAVHSVVLHGLPSTVYRPSRGLPSAVRGLSCRPSFLIRLFVPHSLTACPLPHPPSISRSILPSVVPHSFIRSPFVDGSPLPVHRPFRGLSCRPRSLIRLFVPHSLTACPSSPQPRKPMYNHPRPTVHRPFRGLSCHPQSLIRLFVLHSLTVHPYPVHRPSRDLPSAVCGLKSTSPQGDPDAS